VTETQDEDQKWNSYLDVLDGHQDIAERRELKVLQLLLRESLGEIGQGLLKTAVD
jgi:hypothetical protein